MGNHLEDVLDATDLRLQTYPVFPHIPFSFVGGDSNRNPDHLVIGTGSVGQHSFVARAFQHFRGIEGAVGYFSTHQAQAASEHANSDRDNLAIELLDARVDNDATRQVIGEAIDVHLATAQLTQHQV